MNGTTRTIAGIAGSCVALAAIVATAQGTPADAASVRPAARVLAHALAYNRDGVQLTCTRREAGVYAVVTGDGRPFVVRCRADGPRYVWDDVSG